MDAINNINRVMEVLRRRLAEKSNTQKSEQVSLSTLEKKQQIQSKASTEELQNQIISRLKNVQGEGEQWQRRAAQIFFESVLAWEFGDEFVQDPKCPELIREMKSMMEVDQNTWKRFNRLLTRLSH